MHLIEKRWKGISQEECSPLNISLMRCVWKRSSCYNCLWVPPQLQTFWIRRINTCHVLKCVRDVTSPWLWRGGLLCNCRYNFRKRILHRSKTKRRPNWILSLNALFLFLESLPTTSDQEEQLGNWTQRKW